MKYTTHSDGTMEMHTDEKEIDAEKTKAAIESSTGLAVTATERN